MEITYQEVQHKKIKIDKLQQLKITEETLLGIFGGNGMEKCKTNGITYVTLWTDGHGSGHTETIRKASRLDFKLFGTLNEVRKLINIEYKKKQMGG